MNVNNFLGEDGPGLRLSEFHGGHCAFQEVFKVLRLYPWRNANDSVTRVPARLDRPSVSRLSGRPRVIVGITTTVVVADETVSIVLCEPTRSCWKSSAAFSDGASFWLFIRQNRKSADPNFGRAGRLQYFRVLLYQHLG